MQTALNHVQIHEQMRQQMEITQQMARDQARRAAEAIARRNRATLNAKKGEDVRDNEPREILVGMATPLKDQANKWKDFADQQDKLSLKKIEGARASGELTKEQYWTLRGRLEGIQAMGGLDEFTTGSHRFFQADQDVKEGKMSLQEAQALKNGYVEGVAYITRRGGIMPPPGKNDKYGIGDPTTFGDDKKFLIVKDAVRNIIEVKLHPY